MGSGTQRQEQRKSIARTCGSHLTGCTARNGWARFSSVSDAELAATLMSQDDEHIVTVVYAQSNQIALDWSDSARYHNGNVVRGKALDY